MKRFLAITLLVLMLLAPSGVFAAIAHVSSFDTTNTFSGSFDGGSGANRVIVFHGSADTSDNITAITWNGEGFTKLGVTLFAATGRYNTIWCLSNPSGSGSQNYVISGASGSSVITFSVYSGAGTCQNYIHTTGSGTAGTATASPVPASTSWLVGGGGNDASAEAMGSNTTQRGLTGSSQATADSNGVASPTALNFTHSSGNWAAYLVELTVAAGGGGAAAAPRQDMLIFE
jgi:hypothetical protein